MYQKPKVGVFIFSVCDDLATCQNGLKDEERLNQVKIFTFILENMFCV